MDIIAANSIVLPLFATWFIPVSVRDPRTGEFKGFQKTEFLVTIAALILFECTLMINQFGVQGFTFIRICVCVLTTGILAFLFIKWTNKKAFGKEFEFKLNAKE